MHKSYGTHKVWLIIKSWGGGREEAWSPRLSPNPRRCNAFLWQKITNVWICIYLVICSADISHGLPVNGAEETGERRLRQQTLFLLPQSPRAWYSSAVVTNTRSAKQSFISFVGFIELLILHSFCKPSTKHNIISEAYELYSMISSASWRLPPSPNQAFTCGERVWWLAIHGVVLPFCTDRYQSDCSFFRYHGHAWLQ